MLPYPFPLRLFVASERMPKCSSVDMEHAHYCMSCLNCSRKAIVLLIRFNTVVKLVTVVNGVVRSRGRSKYTCMETTERIQLKRRDFLI